MHDILGYKPLQFFRIRYLGVQAAVLLLTPKGSVSWVTSRWQPFVQNTINRQPAASRPPQPVVIITPIPPACCCFFHLTPIPPACCCFFQLPPIPPACRCSFPAAYPASSLLFLFHLILLPFSAYPASLSLYLPQQPVNIPPLTTCCCSLSSSSITIFFTSLSLYIS